MAKRQKNRHHNGQKKKGKWAKQRFVNTENSRSSNTT